MFDTMNPYTCRDEGGAEAAAQNTAKVAAAASQTPPPRKAILFLLQTENFERDAAFLQPLGDDDLWRESLGAFILGTRMNVASGKRQSLPVRCEDPCRRNAPPLTRAQAVQQRETYAATQRTLISSERAGCRAPAPGQGDLGQPPGEGSLLGECKINSRTLFKRSALN